MNRIKILMTIFKILKLLLLFKFSILKPKKSKIAIFDEDNSKLIKKFLKKYDYQIINTRLEKINIYILLLLIFSKKKLSFRNYIVQYLKITKSTIIFNGFDNNMLFLTLKNDLKNIQTICMQQAWRGPFFFKEITKKYENLKSDLFFTFSKSFSKIFSKSIKSEFIEIGSFINNSVPKIKNKNHKSIGFISELSWGSKKKYMNISNFKIAVKKFFYYDKILLQELLNFCIQKKIKLKIIGKLNSPWEKKFYSSILGEENFIFIPNYPGRNIYNICDKLKFTVGSFSTLLLENFSRGNVTAVFNTKILSTKNEDFNIFFPNKINSKGEFWTKYINKNEIFRILNFCYNVNHSTWKKILNKHENKSIQFDKNNSIFEKKIKKLINKNLN